MDLRTTFGRIKPFFAAPRRREIESLKPSEILNTFAPDLEFDLQLLHERYLAEYTGRHSKERLTIDYINLDFAGFESDHRFAVRQTVFLFTDGSGDSASPAMYCVTQRDESDLQGSGFHIEYGFGRKDENGRLLYPARDRHLGAFDECPKEPDGWAIYEKLALAKSLSQWRTRE